MEDIIIPIAGIIGVFGLPALVVLGIVIAVYKSKVARYKIIEQAVNSNASPEIVEKLVATIRTEESKKTAPSRQKNLIHGTLLLAVGIALMAFWLYDGNVVPLYAGTLLTLIGVAKFIIAVFIIKRDVPEQSE
jgi:membrane protein YdbS with pleckstrin-like domain